MFGLGWAVSRRCMRTISRSTTGSGQGNSQHQQEKETTRTKSGSDKDILLAFLLSKVSATGTYKPRAGVVSLPHSVTLTLQQLNQPDRT